MDMKTDGALLPCPCGVIPTELGITDAGQGGKWANVDGGCCGYWSVEFRTQYNHFGTPEMMLLATEAWNEAPRTKVPHEPKH